MGEWRPKHLEPFSLPGIYFEIHGYTFLVIAAMLSDGVLAILESDGVIAAMMSDGVIAILESDGVIAILESDGVIGD